MTTATQTNQQGVYQFNSGETVYWEVDTERRTLPSDLDACAPDQWMWCFDCERAFQLDEARSGAEAHCPYTDCAALPVSFWKWESYRSFSGARIVPTHDRPFPLAAAA